MSEKPIQQFAAMDIEATGLDASYGRLVCVCFKFEGEKKVRTMSIKSVHEEKELLEWVQEQYDQVDVLVTWNGKRYDVPFLNARMFIHGMKPLVPKKHLDLMYKAKAIRTRGARLDGFAKDMGLAHQKFDVPASAWILAAEGDEKAIKDIVKHCELDVKITEDAARKVRPMIVRITR